MTLHCEWSPVCLRSHTGRLTAIILTVRSRSPALRHGIFRLKWRKSYEIYKRLFPFVVNAINSARLLRTKKREYTLTQSTGSTHFHGVHTYTVSGLWNINPYNSDSFIEYSVLVTIFRLKSWPEAYAAWPKYWKPSLVVCLILCTKNTHYTVYQKCHLLIQT